MQALLSMLPLPLAQDESTQLKLEIIFLCTPSLLAPSGCGGSMSILAPLPQRDFDSLFAVKVSLEVPRWHESTAGRS